MTTAADLVRDGFILAQVLDPEETLPGNYASIGLNVLNDILAQWSSLGCYLESYFVQSVSLTTPTYQYSITPTVTQMLQGRLIDSSNCVSTLIEADLKLHNAFNYALSVTGPARPQYVHFQNAINNVPPATFQTTTTTFFYPVPDQAYTATLYLKKHITQLAQSDTITELSGSYLKPVKFQLAKDLSVIFNTVLSNTFYEEYEKQMLEMKASNKKDMTVVNTNPFFSFTRRYRPWGGYVG